MMRIDQRLDCPGGTALRVNAVEFLVDRNRVGDGFLRGAVIPLSDDFDYLELLARFIEDLVESVVPVAVDRVSRRAAHLKELAAVCLDLLQEPARGEPTEFDLVDIHRDCIGGLNHIVEGQEHYPGGIGAFDYRRERGRVKRVNDDRIIAGVDEVIGRGDLSGEILAGRDHFELFDLALDARLIGISLGRFDHLDAPGVSDETVDERNTIRPVFLWPLEIFRGVAPRLEAVGIDAGAGDDLRTGREGRRGDTRIAATRRRTSSGPGRREPYFSFDLLRFLGGTLTRGTINLSFEEDGT